MATKKETETVENFDSPRASASEMMLFMKKYNRNEVLLAGTVTQLEVSQPAPKIDKKTNQQVLSEDGTPQFWEPFYTASISFEGGMTRLNLSHSVFALLVQGERYLFVGAMGNAFGKVQPVFHDAQPIV